jgi:hypothetical protein
VKRLGALVLAVVLVVAALWIRGRIGSGPGGGSESASRLTCASELAAACDRLGQEHGLEVTVEPAGETAAHLQSLAAGADPEFDVWLTVGPYDEVVTTALATARRDDVLGKPTPALGHSPLGFFVHQSRAGALEAHCGGSVAWACVLSAVGRQWGDIGGDPLWGPVKPHLEDPDRSAGLLALGNAAAALVGPEADDLDISENAAFLTSLDTLARTRVKPELDAGAALARMLAAGAAEIDFVVGLESSGHRFAQTLPDRARLLYPSPVAGAAVVALPRTNAGRGVDKLMERLREDAPEALGDLGWRAGAPPAASAQARVGVGGLLRLRSLWNEAR